MAVDTPGQRPVEEVGVPLPVQLGISDDVVLVRGLHQLHKTTSEIALCVKAYTTKLMMLPKTMNYKTRCKKVSTAYLPMEQLHSSVGTMKLPVVVAMHGFVTVGTPLAGQLAVGQLDVHVHADRVCRIPKHM